MPDALLLPLAEQLMGVITFSRTVSEVKRDDEAKDLWAKVYHDLSEGKPGLLEQYSRARKRKSFA